MFTMHSENPEGHGKNEEELSHVKPNNIGNTRYNNGYGYGYGFVDTQGKERQKNNTRDSFHRQHLQYIPKNKVRKSHFMGNNYWQHRYNVS
jgi:hypothetical protein